MQTHAYIRATGRYVPDKIVKNNDLAEVLDTSDEWIQKRVGIKERRYADPEVQSSDLAKEAVLDLISKNDIDLQEIDCIILATLSPDHHFPGTAMFLQEKLGIGGSKIPCFDIRQQCSGFIYGLQMAQAFVENKMYQNVLLVGTEVHSHALDYSPRGRAVTVIFGDGAAAVVVSASENTSHAILTTELHSDGRGAMQGVHHKLFNIGKKPIVYYNPFDFETNADLYPDMNDARKLFTSAIKSMTEVSLTALKKLNLNIDQIDWVLPHQANYRINKLTAEQLGIADQKVLYNIHKYGNTTAATIPLLLSEFTDDGTIRRGDLLLMVAFGSGFTWGAAVVRY